MALVDSDHRLRRSVLATADLYHRIPRRHMHAGCKQDSAEGTRAQPHVARREERRHAALRRIGVEKSPGRHAPTHPTAGLERVLKEWAPAFQARDFGSSEQD